MDLQDSPRLESPQKTVVLFLAPLIAGRAIQLILFGFCLSAWVHYLNSPDYKNDSKLVRRLIFAVMIINIMQTCLDFEALLHDGVTQDRASADVMRFRLPDCLMPIEIALVGALVQAYLARRSFLLLRKRNAQLAFSAVFAASYLTSLGAALCYIVLGFRHWKRAAPGVPSQAMNNAAVLFFASAALTDVLISASLAWSLGKEIRGFNPSTDSLLRRIIRITLATAAYTAFIAVVGAILGACFGPQSPYATVPYPLVFVLPPIYTLSLFTTTYVRQSLRSNSPGVLTPQALHPSAATDSGFADTQRTIRSWASKREDRDRLTIPPIQGVVAVTYSTTQSEPIEMQTPTSMHHDHQEVRFDSEKTGMTA